MRICSHIRLRHFRGKGVHSPFMYSVVRGVFMKRDIEGNDRELYDKLREKGMDKRTSVMLQNLFSFCRLDSYIFAETKDDMGAPSGRTGTGPRTICILCSPVRNDILTETASALEGCESILAIDMAKQKKEVIRMTNRVWEKHRCVVVDRGKVMLLFFDPRLQKQYYRI